MGVLLSAGNVRFINGDYGVFHFHARRVHLILSSVYLGLLAFLYKIIIQREWLLVSCSQLLGNHLDMMMITITVALITAV